MSDTRDSWSVHGDSFAAASICEEAAQSIREANLATLPADGYPGLRYPSDAYLALSALWLMTERLPQTLRQIDRFIQRQVDSNLVSIDDGTPHDGDPESAAAALHARLVGRAIPALHALASALDDARQSIAHAGARDALAG